jgi:hypothetical protein
MINKSTCADFMLRPIYVWVYEPLSDTAGDIGCGVSIYNGMMDGSADNERWVQELRWPV